MLLLALFIEVVRLPREIFWSQGYKICFVFNCAEHDIFSADKHENANLCWHFHIDKHGKAAIFAMQRELGPRVSVRSAKYTTQMVTRLANLV